MLSSERARSGSRLHSRNALRICIPCARIPDALRRDYPEHQVAPGAEFRASNVIRRTEWPGPAFLCPSLIIARSRG